MTLCRTLFSNLLVAGKCISGDQVAVAMALKAGKSDVRELDVAELQDVLRQNGIELDPDRHKPFLGWSKADRTVRNWRDDA